MPQASRSPVETDVKRWRTLDVHGKRTFLESAPPRIICTRHGKITAAVPWARHDDRFSGPFEEFAAWKAAHMPWPRAAAELRITWEALANITARVAADAAAGTDRLDGLRRIGIDEKSWGKGAGKYLVIVTGHDAGRVVWAAEGRDQATVRAFFDALGPARTRLLTHVSADGASWIHPVVAERAPQAEICLDAFHIVKWAGDKLDELRRRVAGELLSRWIQPLLDDIDKLAANYNAHQTRVIAIQHHLVELIDLIDPGGDRIPANQREQM
ncbi:MAG TPA: transposase [Streptosporangiaceae bacterium]|jgi:transposase|nr:transposase [Streptosporangiaceae bacterium]